MRAWNVTPNFLTFLWENSFNIRKVEVRKGSQVHNSFIYRVFTVSGESFSRSLRVPSFLDIIVLTLEINYQNEDLTVCIYMSSVFPSYRGYSSLNFMIPALIYLLTAFLSFQDTFFPCLQFMHFATT